MKSIYLLVVILILGSTFVLAYGSIYKSDSDTHGIFKMIPDVAKLHISHFASILSKPPSSFTSSGIIVPLYSEPGDDWTRVVMEKENHPLVPILAIVNPKNGSGSAQNPVYVDATKQLEIAHVTVLGYVYTQYGQRNSTDIKNEILNYKNWYHADGIFFDEMSSVKGNEIYYKDLNDYAKSIGMKYTVGNPGRDMSPSYIGTVDNLVIYDNPGLPPLATLDGWHNFTKSNFSIMGFNVNNFDKSYVTTASHYVKYVYITNGTLPDPWGVMSPYLENLTATMQGILLSENKIQIMSPLRQFRSGVAVNDVQCSEGLQLMLKKENRSPACVMSSSIPELVQRGWGEQITSIEEDRQIYMQ